MLDALLHRLVADLDEHWRRSEHDELAFPAIARACLTRASLAEHIDAAAILAHAARPWPGVRAMHGAPDVVTLFQGHRFAIYAHFWFDDVAPPHDHGWAGAFQLVAGRSLNVEHRFEQHERVCEALRIGRLQAVEHRVLAPGDCVEVVPGTAFIHGLAYVDRPGVAVSVRSTARVCPSFTYHRPRVALDHQACDRALECRLQALRLAHACDAQLWQQQLLQLVRAGDRLTTLFALGDAATFDWPLPPSVVEAGHERHGDGFAALLDAHDDMRLHAHVVELRRDCTDPRLRSLFAALYCCSDRPGLLRALALLFPEQHVESLLGECLVALLVEAEPDTPIPGYFAPMFAHIAAGRAPTDIAAELALALPQHELEFFESARAALLDGPLYHALFRNT